MASATFVHICAHISHSWPKLREDDNVGLSKRNRNTPVEVKIKTMRADFANKQWEPLAF